MKNEVKKKRSICVIDWTLIIGLITPFAWVGVIYLAGSERPFGGSFFLGMLGLSIVMTFICIARGEKQNFNNIINILLSAWPFCLFLILIVCH